MCNCYVSTIQLTCFYLPRTAHRWEDISKIWARRIPITCASLAAMFSITPLPRSSYSTTHDRADSNTDSTTDSITDLCAHHSSHSEANCSVVTSTNDSCTVLSADALPDSNTGTISFSWTNWRAGWVWWIYEDGGTPS